MPAPYETPVFIPPRTNTLVKPLHAPMQIACSPRYGTTPTPPSSTPRSSSKTSECSPVTALPGTMSARRVQRPSNTRRRTREDGRNACGLEGTEQEPPRLGARMKASLRGMFKKSSTDESTLERIGDRHWTDE